MWRSMHSRAHQPIRRLVYVPTGRARNACERGVVRFSALLHTRFCPAAQFLSTRAFESSRMSLTADESRLASAKAVEAHATLPPPTGATDVAEPTHRPVTEMAASSSAVASADDFFARAQALGLRLTRTDYERTRAGVAAFLRAERLPDDDKARERAGSPAESEQTRAPQLSRWLRTTSGQLSFFTDVVHSGTSDEGRRLSLDEVGSAEERRRRRLRRRRLLEKKMLLETGASPGTSPRTARASSVVSDATSHDLPTTPERKLPMTPTSSLSPLDERSASPKPCALNRRARMDNGKLWLARAPEDELLSSEADDSGVSIDDEPESSDLLGWGPRACVRTPSGTDNLNACMKSMSLLDRIMMTKTSPRRRVREARARDRERADSDAMLQPAPLDDLSSWADVSTESVPAPTPARATHSRHTSLSRCSALATPLRERGGLEWISPLASVTPVSRFDPGTQITPMRYTPNMEGSSFAFSPNVLTPWTHQGRLMSNAGLSNVPSSPFATADYATAGSSAHGAANAARTSLALSSTPLSHLPGSASFDAGHGVSPQRLLCIESFPGRSPQTRDESPTKPTRRLVASPLAAKGRSATSSSTPPTVALASHAPARLDLSNLSWGSMALDPRESYQRTDTISPADIFCSVPDDARSASSVPSSPRASSMSPQASQRPARRKSPAHRAASAATPTHSDDVFASDTDAPFKDVFRAPATGDARQTEWDQPDGSRVVKLVSEELQAALDAGSLEREPEPRYFRLPPGHGTHKTKPSSVSYAGLIGQAILSSSDGRLSLAEIYHWISSVYPYYERGDRGWQNSIRHNLSLNKSFVKLERESTIPGKGGWWAIEPGHEHRFQNGMYLPNGTREVRSYKSGPVAAPPPLERKKRAGAAGDGSAEMDDDDDDAGNSSFKRPKTATSARPRPLARRDARTPHPIEPIRTLGHAMPVLADASSPVSSPMASFSERDADSFDTSASHSWLATPHAHHTLSTVPEPGARAPSLLAAARPATTAPASVPQPPSQPFLDSAPPRTLGDDYMFVRHGMPMASSPKQVTPFSHLQAHVPLVPTPYTYDMTHWHEGMRREQW